jgi:hypothetical protein
MRVITDIQHRFDEQVLELKAGRLEVSNAQFVILCLVLVVIVGCLAAQNALYGYSQGSTFAAMVLLAVMYFAGDWALATLTSMSTRAKSAGVLCFIAKAGLVLLSVTAGVSFMLSQQHAKDVSNSRVASLEAQIAINQEAFQKYQKTITAERLERLNAELEAERARVGANHASSNALYVYVAQLSGFSFELVSFSIRTLWTVVFIITGMTLSSLLGLLWFPWRESWAYSRLLSRERAQLKRAKAHLKLLKQHAALELEAQEECSNKSAQPKENKNQRAPTRDTGTQGSISHRYKEVRRKVSGGELNPSVSSLKRLGMGTNTAQDYLKQLHQEGVIQRSGQGYITAAMQ